MGSGCVTITLGAVCGRKATDMALVLCGPVATDTRGVRLEIG
jgi:hypothetical protein